METNCKLNVKDFKKPGYRGKQHGLNNLIHSLLIGTFIWVSINHVFVKPPYLYLHTCSKEENRSHCNLTDNNEQIMRSNLRKISAQYSKRTGHQVNHIRTRWTLSAHNKRYSFKVTYMYSTQHTRCQKNLYIIFCADSDSQPKNSSLQTKWAK